MRRSGLVLAFLIALNGAVVAGPSPFAYDIQFRPGSDTDALAWTSFGGVFTDDGGASWRWVCLFPLGTGGGNPDSAISPSGAVFHTSSAGLRISRDRCVFDLSPLGERFASRVAIGPDGAIFVAMSEEGDALADPPVPPDSWIYKSIDDGLNFDAGTAVGTGGESWQSLEVAPADPNRVYLAGTRGDAAQQTLELLLFRSDDGGQNFMPLPVSVFDATAATDVKIAAVSRTDPDRVLVSDWDDFGDEALYLSVDGGEAWTRVLQVDRPITAVLFRANGEAVVSTDDGRIYRSTDGQSFELVPQPHPVVGCLRETLAGVLWVCTSRIEPPPYDYRLMTTDLSSWTGRLRYEDLEKMDCPAGTQQHDVCPEDPPCYAAPMLPGCELMLFPDAALPGGPDAPGVDSPGGCCDAGGDGRQSAVLAVGLMVAILRRRRRVRWRAANVGIALVLLAGCDPAPRDIPPPGCGNGVLEPEFEDGQSVGETCDDGPLTGTAESLCSVDCQSAKLAPVEVTATQELPFPARKLMVSGSWLVASSLDDRGVALVAGDTVHVLKAHAAVADFTISAVDETDWSSPDVVWIEHAAPGLGGPWLLWAEIGEEPIPVIHEIPFPVPDASDIAFLRGTDQLAYVPIVMSVVASGRHYIVRMPHPLHPSGWTTVTDLGPVPSSGPILAVTASASDSYTSRMISFFGTGPAYVVAATPLDLHFYVPPVVEYAGTWPTSIISADNASFTPSAPATEVWTQLAVLAPDGTVYVWKFDRDLGEIDTTYFARFPEGTQQLASLGLAPSSLDIEGSNSSVLGIVDDGSLAFILNNRAGRGLATQQFWIGPSCSVCTLGEQVMQLNGTEWVAFDDLAMRIQTVSLNSGRN
jgi:hypothetical protein